MTTLKKFYDYAIKNASIEDYELEEGMHDTGMRRNLPYSVIDGIDECRSEFCSDYDLNEEELDDLDYLDLFYEIYDARINNK